LRSNHYFCKYLDDRSSGGFANSSIEGDDTAKCGDWIGSQSLAIGLFAGRPDAYAGRVCVFDDRASEVINIADKTPRSISIDVVIERHFLAVQQLGAADTMAG